MQCNAAVAKIREFEQRDFGSIGHRADARYDRKNQVPPAVVHANPGWAAPLAAFAW